MAETFYSLFDSRGGSLVLAHPALISIHAAR